MFRDVATTSPVGYSVLRPLHLRRMCRRSKKLLQAGKRKRCASCSSCIAARPSAQVAMPRWIHLGLLWKTTMRSAAGATKKTVYQSMLQANLPVAERFSGPVELKDVLLEERESFAKTLIRNLLIYALGRGLRGSDECVVRDCLSAASENEDRFSSIVVEITKSVPFRYRRNPID